MNNDLTNSFITKTNNIINYLEKFDNIFKILIEIKNKKMLLPENIKQIAEITELFIFIRGEHGSLILILDKFKKSILADTDTTISDELINKNYTLSTFFSIIESISAVIGNIDFEYKQIALKFPNFINKKTLTLILVVNNKEHKQQKENENDKFINIIHELQKLSPENVYKIITTNDKIINVKDIVNKDLDLNIKSFPSLFMINGDVITEISLEQNNTLEQIKNLIN